ncbi:MAG: V-type ATP synthase subunit K [Thermoplasmata archaeon]|nr:MAG: V-type ATP synthase subunit K [Thermoplasmata archaeon]
MLGAYLAAIGAGIAIGISGMGAGIGVGIAGAAGSGVVAEKPQMFSRAILFQALPQTQAIYGLLIAIIILLKTGLIGGHPENIGIGVGLIAIGCGLAVGIAGLSAIGQGIAASSSIGVVGEKSEMFGRAVIFSVLPETQAIYGLLIAIIILHKTGLIGVHLEDVGIGVGLIAVGCGLAVGIAGMSAIGQGIAASSGIGVVGKKPEMFGRAIIFSVLPETQAIYGLLIAILLLAFSGVFGGKMGVSQAVGIAALGSGLAVGIAGLSAIGQGITGAAAIQATARNPQSMTRGIIFSVMSETFAIFGLLIAIFIMIGIGLM